MSKLEVSRVLEVLLDGLVPPFILKQQSDDVKYEPSGLWAVDTSWSHQAELLQKEMLCCGHPLNAGHVVEHLKHLRLVDRQIETLDKKLQKYTQLKELVLTGNHIREVEGTNLPSSLEVLELSLNAIVSLESLDKNPPPQLTHLGVSYNRLTCLNLTPAKWSRLLSLDISGNGITDTAKTLSVLEALPSLRSLLFCGNPAALSQAYPRCFANALKDLQFIDGEEVSTVMRNSCQLNASKSRQDQSLHTTSSVTIEADYSLNAPLSKKELTEGEKDLFFICFNCTFLEPTCYTNIAKPETLHSPLNSDILKRVPSSHQTALILGPAVLDVAGTDAYSNNIGEPASKDLTVRDLLKLHALIKTGLQVQPLLAHAVLRQKDEIEHQGRNLDQKPSSRAPSPTKPQIGKKDKKATKGRPQNSLEGWKLHSLDWLTMESCLCKLEDILEGGGSAVSKSKAVVPMCKLVEWGLQCAESSDTPEYCEVSVMLKFSVHHI